jgi:hypothetical protein
MRKASPFGTTSRASGERAAELDVLVAEIEESNREILSRYTPEAMKSAVEAKLNASVKSGRVLFAGKAFRAMRAAAIPAAACLVLAFAFVTTQGLSRNPAGGESSGIAGAAESGAGVSTGERSKGAGPTINVYRKTGADAIRLKRGDRVSANDALQISYLSNGNTWGVILSVDGNGVITRHYPDAGNGAAPLDTSGEVPLAFSYVLDDAPKYERFIFVSSKSAFPAESVIGTIESLSMEPGFAALDLSEKLPKGLAISDIVLVK